jgi:putative flippase GtrA
MNAAPKSAVSAQSSPRVLARKFMRFLLVGGFCTALQYVLLVVFVEEFRLSATLSSTIGYVLSSAANYLLNYSFTFRSTSPHGRSLPRFLIIAGCGAALNGLVTYLGTTVFGAHYLVAQVAATIATLLWNFMANLRWTY